MSFALPFGKSLPFKSLSIALALYIPISFELPLFSTIKDLNGAPAPLIGGLSLAGASTGGPGPVPFFWCF